MPEVVKAEAEWEGSEAPASASEYATWISATHGVDLVQEKLRYEAASAIMLQKATSSGIWTEFQTQRRDLNDAYLEEHSYQLFAFPTDDAPKSKSWASFLDKSFRKNVVENENWPNAPVSGWSLPQTWLVSVHDIVRTSVVVKYLDGVEFVTDALERIAGSISTAFECDYQARSTGYYAAHTYSNFQVNVPDHSWQAVVIDVALEVQVTTQLQEVIGKLTHTQYENRRSKPPLAGKNWQWDYRSEEFQPNYLGHLLHYAEGMIMEVRERDRSK